MKRGWMEKLLCTVSAALCAVGVGVLTGCGSNPSKDVGEPVQYTIGVRTTDPRSPFMCAEPDLLPTGGYATNCLMIAVPTVGKINRDAREGAQRNIQQVGQTDVPKKVREKIVRMETRIPAWSFVTRVLLDQAVSVTDIFRTVQLAKDETPQIKAHLLVCELGNQVGVYGLPLTDDAYRCGDAHKAGLELTQQQIDDMGMSVSVKFVGKAVPMIRNNMRLHMLTQ